MCRLSETWSVMGNKKTVILIIPSVIVSRGVEGILAENGEFRVVESLSDCSRSSQARLRSLEPDVVVMDPAVLDFHSRKVGRNMLADCCDSTVIALEGPATTEDVIKQYDGSISIYDDALTIVKKLRAAIDSRIPELSACGNELSAREKDILVCVAQGMLNKEIADKFNLSIYTVITHRKNITRKTGIKTVAGLTVYAILNNLIDMNSVQ